MRGDYRGVPPHVGRGLYEGRIPAPGEPTLNGLFRTNPVRRSAGLIAGCLAVLGVATVLVHRGGESALILIVAALASAILLIAVPLLLWSLLDEGARRYRRRTSPDLAALRLPLRTENILRRAGYETVADLAPLSDEALYALPRMADHDVRHIRRALGLHAYRTWQEAGFPSR